MAPDDYIADLEAAAEAALASAVGHPDPPRSGRAWETYRIAAGRLVEARTVAARLAARKDAVANDPHA